LTLPPLLPPPLSPPLPPPPTTAIQPTHKLLTSSVYEGAELFAKRRRKADNWIVDETNLETQNPPSGIPDYQQYQQKPAISPNILPAYSDAGKHRVQLNIHQNQLIEKYSKPGLQVVQSPWDAALQTGSASTAFLEDKDTKSQCFSPAAVSPTPYFQSGRRDFTDAVEPTHYSPQKDYNNVCFL